jgi:broad specificity phosphatase PhoE
MNLSIHLPEEPVSGVFSGPQSCCVTTAKLLKKGNVTVLDGLIDINLGLWQGMLVDELEKKHPKAYKKWREDPCSVEIMKGERLEGASKRVLRSISDVIRKHAERVLVVVSPNIAALIKINFNADLSLSDLWRVRDQMAAVEIVNV